MEKGIRTVAASGSGIQRLRGLRGGGEETGQGAVSGC